jgi:hypothetical protein
MTAQKKFGIDQEVKDAIDAAAGAGPTQTDLDAVESSVLADLTALRNAVIAVTAKIDASTVIGLATNYGATCNPAALTTA